MAKENQNCTEEKAELIKKLEKLTEEEADIDKEIASLREEGITTDTSAEVQALHKYNEMKDLTQHIIGILATIKCTTTADIHKRFNLPLD